MNSHRRSRWRGSRPALGSSSRSTSGLASRPIAMFTRWRLPPDSSATWSRARSRRPVSSSIRPTAAAGSATRSRRANRSRFSSTVSFPYRATCWGTQPTSPRGLPTVPSSGRWMPARIDSRVVLPAPLGPITATSSPRPALSDTPRSAWRSPKRFTRPLASSTGAAVASSMADTLAESPAVKLLFVGDVVGGLGRRTLASLLPALRERHEPDWVVVNGENAAGGVGITEKTARELLDLGADAITLGNHAYRHREVYGFLDREERIVRPANYPKGSPGRGHTVVERDGMRLGVTNLSGLVFLQAVRSPFAEADAVLAELRGRADAVLVDIHAEATSEKVAS